MRTNLPPLVIFLAGWVLSGCVPPLETAPTPQDEVPFTFQEDHDPAIAALDFVDDELLVQPYPGAAKSAVQALYAQTGAVVIDELAEIDLTVLQVAQGALASTAFELEDSKLIETIQKNYVYQSDAVPNDPIYARQEHLPQIHAPQAWDSTVGAASIVIAIVDTGVDGDHPDLVDKITDGWNVNGGNSDFSDVMGHGTQVAGVAAAASNNGVGIAGVAWGCPILAVRVGDSQGQSTGRNIAAGILWAVSHGAKVVNVSFAPLWSDRVVRAAAQQAFNRGALVVISAGNAGGTTTAAGYDEALFVGAVNTANQVASFSDRGPFVDLVAPGTGIRSTIRGGDYGLTNGTSFAAPIVAGVAALAWSTNVDLRPRSIQDALLNNVVDLGDPGRDSLYGYGAVDAAAAVEAAALLTPTSDTAAPVVRVSKPTANEAVSGRYTVSIEATDASGVADVVFSVDGLPFATDTRSPYQFVIDAATFSTGRHEFSFVATDFAGNASAPARVSVTFERTSTAGTSGGAASIVFKSPSASATVSGDVTIQATVSDADGLGVVEWFIDGVSVFIGPLTGTSTGVSYQWRAESATAGPHRITIIVTDATGRQTSGSLDLSRR